MNEMRVIPVEGMPEIEEGAKLGALIARAAEIESGDVDRRLAEGRLEGRGPPAQTPFGHPRRGGAQTRRLC